MPSNDRSQNRRVGNISAKLSASRPSSDPADYVSRFRALAARLSGLVRTGIAAFVLLIVPFLAACAANSAHYVCQFAPQDSTGTYAGTIFSQEIVIIHKKGSSLIYGGENGLEWIDYQYDKAETPGFVAAGRLNNELHGRARFWFPTGKLWINLPPGTLLSYKCSEFEP